MMNLCDWDALTKMAVIHHQFESIHPFYDGNGRTGRIINILYLVKQGLLSLPVLYLSRYINQEQGRLLPVIAVGPRGRHLGGVGLVHARRRGADFPVRPLCSSRGSRS